MINEDKALRMFYEKYVEKHKGRVWKWEIQKLQF